MATTRKKDEVPTTNSNVNTNNNTINVNVNVEKPKSSRKKKAVKEESKPNWIIKAVVVGLLGLILPFFWNYIKNVLEGGHGKPAGVYIKPIEGKKVN